MHLLGFKYACFYSITVPVWILSLNALEIPANPYEIVQQTQHQITASRNTEATMLFRQAVEYYFTRDYHQAIVNYQKALTIQLELGDSLAAARTLNAVGLCYYALRQFPEALKYYQKALVIFRDIRSDKQTTEVQEREATTLNNLGGLYAEVGNNAQALEVYQQAIAILKKTGNNAELGKALNNLGTLENTLGKYAEALNHLQQALQLTPEDDDPEGRGVTLHSIGIVYYGLAQYTQALAYYHQALKLLSTTKNFTDHARVLNSIGLIYSQQKKYSQTLEFYRRALTFQHKGSDRLEEGRTLNNLGWTYVQLGKPTEGLVALQQALKITQALGDRKFEAHTLDSLGTAYEALGQINQAIVTYQRSLAVRLEVEDREGEGFTLSNIGQLLEKQNQPELAIAFYKQSVNVREGIRKGIRALSRDLQQSYTNTVAETYRSLADLLLAQGRILEAQQVLELLKIQEIRDYTRDTRSVAIKDGSIQYTPVEQKIVNQFGNLIAFGKKVADCERAKCAQLSQLNQQREALTAQYNEEIQQIQKEIRDRRSKDDAFFDPRNLGTSAQKIVEAQPNTLLIYPLVLNEKLWLLWVAPNGVVNRVEVPVSQKQLGDTVLKFRQLLGDPTSDVAQVQATGKQLYQWLIQPLEKELASNKVQTLIFSLDRVTRYIPMAALFDGKRYLIDRYQVSTILSADLTDISNRLPNGAQNTQVLAMGLSEAKAGFSALPNVPAELDEIVRTDAKDQSGVYPGAVLLNQAFTFRSLADNLLGHTIIHIATHGKFVAGSFDTSYLLTGTGEVLTIPQINTLSNLSKVQLVVLSACETALGGPDAEGLEISGLAYYFTVGDRAKAVLASLWSVNDTSTTQLMQQFYKNLATGKLTKAEALRQAQLTLMQVGNRASQQARGDSFKLPAINSSQAPISRNFSHPYYWAPFILIGNSL